MLLGFCEHLVDADAVAPYLQELLSKLYTITLTTTNDLTREKVIFAISSIVITCRAHFSEVRRRASKKRIHFNFLLGPRRSHVKLQERAV